MEENNVDNELIEKSEEISVEGNDTIKIANEAVATYAGIAVSEVSGVYGMAGGFAGITEALSGKKNLAKGIKVDVGEKSAKIDVNIIVEYGARIPDVAFEIQTRVKKSVENMTGLKVLEVNVHVQGVHAITEKENNETNNDSEENE
ncbi:MAG TPA: Asp23/Gls24 family envelope stress response protein [Candidatus Scatovivens faecipullorum]|nr:Asp23/Gls24 family envelope stress response protein [Candidatus Scatovivens faecipullorum]